MRIGDIDIAYLSHVCFQFRSRTGTRLLTDPFFADGFEWEGHFEKHLSPSDIGPGDIRKCDVIFVSHVHGDHFDPEAILTIHKNCGCSIVAPNDVVEALRSKKMAQESLLPARETDEFTFADLKIQTFCGYDNSTDEQGRPNKFSILIQTDSTKLFYSGDCHEIPPALRGVRVDAMFCWPHSDDHKLLSLCHNISTKRFVLMHGDRFEPGEFLCNLDYRKEKQRLERLMPEMEVLVPIRAKALEE